MNVRLTLFFVVQATICGMVSIAAVQVFAQDEPGVSSPAAAIAGTGFTYQGRIEADGSPINGQCNLLFSLWDSPIDGIQAGGNQALNGVPVVNGLFAVVLNGSGEFGVSPFSGQARWLQASVSCGGDLQTLTPRKELTPTPYALALVPGSRIDADTSAPALAISNVGSGGEGIVIGPTEDDAITITDAGEQGISIAGTVSDGLRVADAGAHGLRVLRTGADGLRVSDADGFGVNVENSTSSAFKGYSTGGHGIEAAASLAAFYGGLFTNASASGRGAYVRGGGGTAADLVLGANDNTTSGDDGRILSDPSYAGSDIFLVSRDGIVAQLDANNDEAGNFVVADHTGAGLFDVDEAGNLTQTRDSFGLPKVMTEAFCDGDSSSIDRYQTLYFAGLAPGITNGATDGECTIDFGFDVSDRYIAVAAISSSSRMVTFLRSGSDVQDLLFFLHDAAGENLSGRIMVIVY